MRLIDDMALLRRLGYICRAGRRVPAVLSARFRSGMAALAWLAAVAMPAAHAQDARTGLLVTVPNGYATITTDDMQLASTAGSVRWMRVWDGQEWRFNPQWESLSQSWKNLTGSQSADTTGGSTASGTGTPGVTLSASSSGSASDGCWVWVDEDWTPSVGTAVIGGIPEAGPMLPGRTTPFNRVMGEAAEDYPPIQRVSVDYASLCAGSAVMGGGMTRDAEGIRRINELYLGDSGRYAFNNRSVLEKREVRQIPVAAGGGLASGAITMSPERNAKGFRWIDKSGDWIDYNTQGQVVAWGDRNDNTVWLVRDASGMVRGVVDGNGRVLLTLHYTGELITEVRDYPINGAGYDLPARSVKYEYDSKNRLTQITDVRGNVTKYEYNAGNRIVKITDPEGRVEQLAYTGETVKQRIAPDGAVTDYLFEFDDTNKQFISKVTGPDTEAGRRVEDSTHNRVGKLVRKIVNGRTEVEVRYDTGARMEIVTNARGFTTRVTRNEFDQAVEVAYPDGATKKRAYSALNLNVTEKTDELGIKTTYEYDGKGNQIRRIDAAGTADSRTTDYEVNAAGQVIKATRRGRTEANGTVTPDGVWTLAYDALGQVSSTTDPEGNVRLYAYDRAGNLRSFTDPRGNVTTYDVDAEGNLVKVTDPLGRTSSYKRDKVGNIVEYVDERGKTTLAKYDAMNRHVQTTNPVGGVYKVQYNGQGLPTSYIDEDGRISQAKFDAFLRLTSEVDGLGNTTDYGYDIPDGSSTGTLGSLYDPTQTKFPTFVLQQRYDERERPTTETLLNPNTLGTEGLVSTTAYDKRGQILSETDSNGKTRFNTWNALGQLIETTDSLGNKTKALYDTRGNLIQIIDAKGNVNRFEYDRNDRVVKEILPLGQVTQYSYDASGNVTERIDPNGHRTVYVLDAVNRPKEIRQYKASDLVRTTSFTWDGASNLLGWNDTDHVRGETNAGSATYDDASRKTGETFTYPGGFTLSYGYAYSASGQKTRIQWPDGTQIDYGYSLNGELEYVAIPGEGNIAVNSFKWTAPTKITLPGGTTQERVLDGLLNLEGMKVRSPGQAPVLNVANTYGKVLELKKSNRTDSVAGVSSTRSSSYVYDDAIRLTQATTDAGGAFGTDTETFTLDAVGNRIAHSKVSGAWTYDSNNRLTQRGTGANATNYEYDEAGNLTRMTEPGGRVTQYGYDAQNRLQEVKDGSGNLVARYGYDPMDRRLWREQYRNRDGTPLAPAIRTYYLYSDEGLLAEARQSITLNADLTTTGIGSPTLAAEYGPRPNAEFTTAMLFVKTKDSNGDDRFAYYHDDQMGTPIQATDKLGNVVWSASYNVFGAATITTPAATPDKPTIVSQMRLPGQIEDAETGLHYNYRRYYDPSTGRYITQDPIGVAGGVNQYRYADSDPLNLSDPTGECPMCVAFALCMAECMLTDVAINTVTGECNNFGSSAKDCAIGCAAGMGLGWLAGKAWKWVKKAWNRNPCGANSFPVDTLVHVRPDAATDSDAKAAKAILKPISQLQVGDAVLAFSEWKDKGGVASTDDRLSYEKVTDIFTSFKEQRLVHIVLSDGQQLDATEGHPFRTEQGWRDAILLRKGDRLPLAGANTGTSSVAVVTEVSTEVRKLPVFNIEVANAHSFLTGPTGAIAHNGYGSYTCTFKSGKRYHGKGDYERAKKSGKREADRNNDPLDKIDWKKEKNDRDSFKAEAERIRKDGGIQNPDNYNRINSPGAKY